MNAAATRWRESLLVGLGIFGWLAATAWARPLMLPDEGRYVGVAWEMLSSGHWLTPTLDGLPYFHKPPLFYWITAASLALFGPHEWAARAAPLLGATAGAFAVYTFVGHWWNRRAARYALAALLAQPLFFVGGQFANLDMLVAGCITVTVVLLAHAALNLEHGRPFRGVLAAAYAAAAFGVLAKGLIGALLPALVVTLWLLARRRGRALLPLLWGPGVLLFVLVAAPWFIAMQRRFDGFADYFFVVQHFRRFAEGGFNNVQPFWFFPAVLLPFCLPWWPMLAGVFERAPERDDRLRSLMLVWAAVVLMFFSLPQSKLIGYILPAVPPLAVLFADGYLALAPRVGRMRPLWRYGGGAMVALGLAAITALAVHPTRASREIGSLLAAQRQAHEPVLMLGNYWFDLPFYARLIEPVPVVDDWADPAIGRRDNWRKELADAGRFAAPPTTDVLVLPSALAPTLCRARVNWIVGADGEAANHAFLALARSVASRRGVTLWRLDTAVPGVASALGCAGTPNVG